MEVQRRIGSIEREARLDERSRRGHVRNGGERGPGEERRPRIAVEREPGVRAPAASPDAPETSAAARCASALAASARSASAASVAAFPGSRERLARGGSEEVREHGIPAVDLEGALRGDRTREIAGVDEYVAEPLAATGSTGASRR